jgi:hypothetical protein
VGICDFDIFAQNLDVVNGLFQIRADVLLDLADGLLAVGVLERFGKLLQI